MGSILYVEGDDEITSAAARIRGSDDGPVALVIPYGSRLATSRINFRLLAREATARGRELSIIAGDGATRALAGSAGLRAFASVGEYEESLNDVPPVVGPVATSGPVAVPAVTTTPHGPLPAAAPRAPRRDAAGRRRGDAGAAAVVGSLAADAPPAATGVAATSPLNAPVAGSPVTAGTRGRAPAEAAGPSPVAGRLGLETRRIVVAVAAFAVLLAAIAAYLLLPAASIAVTPRPEAIGPLELSIRADPAARSADAAAGVVPARRLTFDVAASDSFAVHGKRIDEARATGRVTFRSKDPTRDNRIFAGAVVATQLGVRFRTTATVVIPRAAIVGLSIIQGQASVGVEAVNPGTDGNVDANTITVIPASEDPIFTDVRNTRPTTGGKHDEFPKIDQADVDAATAQLTDQLGKDFDAMLADPSRVPAGVTVFPATRTLTDPVPAVDLVGLVGQEVPTFELEMRSTGSVTAVDEAAVDAVATTRMSAAVPPGHRLVDGSTATTVGTPTADGSAVVFAVTATAEQVEILDSTALIAQLKGKPAADARRILAQYGDATLTLWPDWVTTVPGIDARIDVRVRAAPSAARPTSTPSPSPPAVDGSASPSSAP